MLGWLNGAGQRASYQGPKDCTRLSISLDAAWLNLSVTDSGDSSYVGESPETPAPVFAVRAFKTALFGTPHPSQNDEATEKTASPEHAGKTKHSPRAKITTPKIGTKSHAARAQRSTPLMSPAKGILVTPGTTAGRRKTVSFGGLSIPDEVTVAKTQDTFRANVAGSQEILDVGTLETTEKQSPSLPTLTKELFEAQLDASKQRLNAHERPAEASLGTKSLSADTELVGLHPVQSASCETTLDFTVDLTKPRSQSGQHWKAEFERYQKNSDLELKKIIQHGQSVKSYAEKKDVEATALYEKLKRELSKCAAMETKVSRLATQLANSKGYGAEESKDQAKLMDDLSRQTALAVRYKQKADRYRVAIKQQKSSTLGGPCDEDQTEDLSAEITHVLDGVTNSGESGGQSELDMLRGELHALRSKLDIAEQEAAKLEVVNAKLTRNVLRIKDEMENCDARRVRKETSLKKREEALVAEKKLCEGKLRRLTKEHAELLRSVERLEVNTHDPLDPSRPRRQSLNRNRTVPLLSPGTGLSQSNHHRVSEAGRLSNVNAAAPSSTNGKNASRGPVIDIWTIDSPNDSVDMSPPAAEPAINLSHVALFEANNNALQEIDGNSVSDLPPEPPLPPDSPRPTPGHIAKIDSALQPDFASSADPSSAVKRMNERRNTIASPRPSMVNMASSVAKEDAPCAAGLQGKASLARTTGSRRPTLSGKGVKIGDLPPDRAAAAKARLAQRKSMKESKPG
ncbi:MAG: hypothetical protein Q9207_000080 [Kuettlingeria erythrocarpa]